MPSSPTSRNRLEKQATGENVNTWGVRLNESGLDLIDAALDGVTSFTMSGPVTLTSVNYAADQSRSRLLHVTGGTGGNLTIPNTEKIYAIRNASSGVVSVGVSGATGAARLNVPAGASGWLWCDGTTTRALVVDETILAAARAYTDDAAFGAASGNLPGQAGNNGRFLQTNGTTAAWADALGRANHTGTQLATTISDFSEAVDDRVAALLAAGAGISLAYDDTANTLTIATSAIGANVQTFNAAGVWTRPAGAAMVKVQVWGAGGGGGSGRRAASGGTAGGGGGGAGGAYNEYTFRASELGTTETITPGAAGVGGAARTVDDTNGQAGTAGGASVFGGTTAANGKLSAAGGAGGAGGSTGPVGGGANTLGLFAAITGLSGGGGGGGFADNAVVAATDGTYGGGGGGGGGGRTASLNNTAGSAGGAGSASIRTGASIQAAATTGGGGAGGNASGPGANGTARAGMAGDGGGGGGGSISGAAFAGGNGAAPAGGGGGGCGGLGNDSGAGGNGAAGRIVVTTWF